MQFTGQREIQYLADLITQTSWSRDGKHAGGEEFQAHTKDNNTPTNFPRRSTEQEQALSTFSSGTS
jgi:hypothetical protein